MRMVAMTPANTFSPFVFSQHFPASSRLALPILFACRLAILQVDLAGAHGAADGLFAGISQGILAIAPLPVRFTHLELVAHAETI